MVLVQTARPAGRARGWPDASRSARTRTAARRITPSGSARIRSISASRKARSQAAVVAAPGRPPRPPRRRGRCAPGRPAPHAPVVVERDPFHRLHRGPAHRRVAVAPGAVEQQVADGRPGAEPVAQRADGGQPDGRVSVDAGPLEQHVADHARRCRSARRAPRPRPAVHPRIASSRARADQLGAGLGQGELVGGPVGGGAGDMGQLGQAGDRRRTPRAGRRSRRARCRRGPRRARTARPASPRAGPRRRRPSSRSGAHRAGGTRLR